MSNTWQDEHRKGIAVSELSAIMGLNPYKSPIQVFMDKMGMSEDTADNLAMKLGRKLEPVIGELFTEHTGLRVTSGEITVHPTRPLIIGTPDFLVLDRNAGMEAKSTGYLKQDEWGAQMTDLMPMHYLMQCHGYIGVTDREEWFLSLLVGGNREFRIYRVARDYDAENRMLDFAEAWYRKHVEGQTPPDLDATKSSDAYLKRMFPKHKFDELISATAEQMNLLETLAQRKAALKALETETETLENQVKAAIGDAAGIVGNGFKATWKANSDSRVIDYKALVAELSPPVEIVEKHTTTKAGARVFRLTEAK